MNLKALITALVLAGTSTAALADPMVRDHRDEPAQVQTQEQVRDHRADAIQPQLFFQRFRTITASKKLKNGETYLGAKTTASKLQIVPLKGNADLYRVVVKFANGSIQNVKLTDKCAVGRPITIDLDGGVRNVVSVAVFSSNAHRAAIELRAA